MRVLVLTSTFPRWAGDAQPPFVLELARRLAASHEVCVVAPHCGGAAERETLDGGLRVRRFRYAPERLESLAYDGGILESLRRAPWRYLLIPFFLLGETVAAVRALREFDPDVVHAHWIVPQGIVALIAGAFAGRRPVVCTSHGADLFALRGSLASRLKSWVLRRSAAATVVSDAMRAEALRLGADPDRVHVMPMGIDARARFLPAAGEPRSGNEILFVGRLVEKKGVACLLEALARLPGGESGAHLCIVGSGPLEAALRDRVRSLGLDSRVRFAGAVINAELAPYYRRAAALVVPSVVARDGDQEGLGLVLAEALACECPVVASDLPAIRDVVEEGVTGYLAAAGDPAALAAAIGRVLENPGRALALARHGRARVLERFDWQGVARGYETLLARAAAR